MSEDFDVVLDARVTAIARSRAAAADVAQGVGGEFAQRFARGRHGEAEAHYRRALRIKETLFGPDHPDVAMTVFNLAVLRTEQHRTQEAEDLYRRALRIFEATVGAGHPKTRTCRRELDALLGGDG